MNSLRCHAVKWFLLAAVVIGCKPKAQPPPPPAPPAAPVPKAPVVTPPKPLPPTVRMPMLTHFQLPTSNTGLLENKNDSFYMYIKRATVSGEVKVWQGGQYGFVRDPKMANDGSITYTRFHEGVDIAPMIRDLKGEPQDEVGAIARGTVVYANNQSGKSNYGNYVIIEHPTEDGPFYSLSAHFHHLTVKRGDQVIAGDVIGIMGHTGSGIDRERSHTHVELNLLLNPKVAIWSQATSAPVQAAAPTTGGKPAAKPAATPTPLLNGQNLVGINVAGWLRTHHEKPETRLADFIRKEPAYFKLRVPNKGRELEITKRYPWLRAPGPPGLAWEIAVAASSVPLKISPVAEKVDFPTISWVQTYTGNHAWKTREMLTGTGGTASLSPHGMAWLKLLLAE